MMTRLRLFSLFLLVFSRDVKFTATGGRWYGPVDEEASRRNQEIVFARATRNSLQFAPVFYYRVNV